MLEKVAMFLQNLLQSVKVEDVESQKLKHLPKEIARKKSSNARSSSLITSSLSITGES